MAEIKVERGSIIRPGEAAELLDVHPVQGAPLVEFTIRKDGLTVRVRMAPPEADGLAVGLVRCGTVAMMAAEAQAAPAVLVPGKGPSAS